MTEPDVTESFVRSYIAAWSTTDSAERRSLVELLYLEDAQFFADEPGDEAVHHRGWDEITANITQVNERLTQGNGLATESTGFVENHDVLRVSWRMTTSGGDIAMNGMNVLVRSADGRILRDYIMIG